MRLKLSKKRCDDVAWEMKNRTARAKRCPETHVFESRQLKPVRREETTKKQQEVQDCTLGDTHRKEEKRVCKTRTGIGQE